MPVNIIQKITYLRVKVSVFCFVFLIKKEEEEKKKITASQQQTYDTEDICAFRKPKGSGL